MTRPSGQEWSEGRVVRLADLVGSYSPRHTRVDEDHVQALTEVLDRLPPVVVDERTMMVIDGVHRVEASRRMGRTVIRALLFSGSETDAVVIAIQANVKHGKPLNRGERQAAAATLLRRCPDRSDRWVAEVCGLSHSTVARVRQAADALGKGVRTGRDGRRRPADPAAGQAAIAKALAEQPESSFRRAAEAAGVATSTVYRAAVGLRGLQGQSGTSLALPEAVLGSAAQLGSTAQHGTAAQLGTAGQVVDLSGSVVGRSDAAEWLSRTAMTLQDLNQHLRDVPLGHIYEVADELRRTARTCLELADALERRARTFRPPRSEGSVTQNVDETVTETGEASRRG